MVFCLCCFLLCGRGNKHFDVHFWRIRLVLFASKDGKDAAYEGRNGWKSVYFPPESASFAFVSNVIKVLFPTGNLTWRVNKYVSRRGKSVKKRNENSIRIVNFVYECTRLIEYFWPTQLTFIDWEPLSPKGGNYLFVECNNCFKKVQIFQS